MDTEELSGDLSGEAVLTSTFLVASDKKKKVKKKQTGLTQQLDLLPSDYEIDRVSSTL